MNIMGSYYLNPSSIGVMELISEAVQLKTIENLKVKRTEITLDRGVSVQKFNAIILPYPNLEESKRVIQRILNDETRFTVKAFESYYYPRVLRKKIGTLNYNERFDERVVYKGIKKDIPSIRYTFRAPTQYQNKNMFVDLSGMIEKIFDRARKSKADVTKDITTAIIEIMDDILKPSWNRVIVWDLGVHPITFKSESSIIESSYKTKQDFMSYVLIAMKHIGMEETLKSLKGSFNKNLTILFTSSKGVLKFDVDEVLGEIIEDKAKKRPPRQLMQLVTRLNLLREDLTIESLENDRDLTEEAKEIIKEEIAKNEIVDVDDIRVEKLDDIAQDLPNSVEEEDKVVRQLNVMRDKAKSKSKRETTKMTKADIMNIQIEQTANAIIKVIREKRVSRNNSLETPKVKAARLRMLDKHFDILDEEANREYMESTKMETTIYDNVTCLDDINENDFINFDIAYDEKLKDRDMIRYFSQFAESETPLFLEKMTKKNASTPGNIVDKYQVTFSDETGKRHTFSFLMPRLVDGTYFLLNNSKKTMKKQLAGKPITKLGKVVRFVSNYNKVFVDSAGGKYPTPYSSVLCRTLEKLKLQNDKIEFGDVSKQLIMDGKATQEFILIAKFVKKINFGKKLSIDFTKFDMDENGVAEIGVKDGQPLYFNTVLDKCVLGDRNSNKAIGELSEVVLTSMITEIEEVAEIAEGIKSLPKNYSAAHMMILGKHIPIIYILMYTDGLLTTMDMAGVEYKIIPKAIDEDTAVKKPKIDKYKEGMIELEDAYIVYSYATVDVVSLMHPAEKLDLTSVSIEDIEDKDTMAVMLEEQSGSANFPVYIDNYRCLLVDAQTREILADHGQPTSFPGVFIYCNTLLTSGASIQDISMEGNRIRSADIVTGIVYDVFAQNFGDYSVKKKRGARNASFSVPVNGVVNTLTALPNVEEYSVLNPVLERDKVSTCSFQGHLGINVSEAYTIQKRLFDESFYGIIGVPSAYGASIGIAKHLTINPKINSLRGYVDTTPTNITLKAKNVFTISEMVTPCGATHDDPPRGAMNMQQVGHLYGVMGADIMPFTYGYDEMIVYMSTDFSRRAKEDGKVIAIDGDFMSVQFSDNTTDVIPLRTIEKNSAKSAFIDNTHVLAPKVKVGFKFKKGDVLTYNKYFFKSDGDKIIMTQGPLVNVGLISCPEIYEDSTLISKSLSHKMSTRKIKNKQVSFTKNCKVLSGITDLVKVKAGDTLIKIIKSTGDDMIDMTDDIEKLGMQLSDINTIEKKTDRVGDIVGIRVYYCFDLTKATNSVQKFIKEVQDNLVRNRGAGQLETFASQDSKAMFEVLPIKVAEGFKVNGKKMYKDQVVVEYMLSMVDKMSRGDKLAFHTALKGIVGRTLPDEDMPVGIESGLRCDILLSVISPLARMVMSPIIIGIGNRILDKMGDDVLDILGIKEDKK